MLFLYGSYRSKKRKTNQIKRNLIVHKSLKQLLIKRYPVIFLISLAALFISPQMTASDDPDDKVDIVVLDAGHGGKDPGALGKNSREKDIVLAITLKLGQYIQENIPDVTVIYTRDKDEFVEVHERANIANKNHADLFISIHANWWTNTRSAGAETFTMGTSLDERNLQVAMKENSVITLEEDYTTNYEGFDPNSAESYIIFNLMQKTFQQQSVDFARLVQDQFRERAKRPDRGVKQERFLVLWRTTMPAVLIETGFISNPTEEAYLRSKQGQEYLASAIYRAFKAYKEDIEGRSLYANSNAAAGKDIKDIPDREIRPKAILQKSTEKIAQDDSTVYYMVQVLTTTIPRPLDDLTFINYGHVAEFKVNNLYKYAVGRSTSYQQITGSLGPVQKDFPGAFVIAVRSGKIISLEEAAEQNK
jgi:N-acetylmuramoyl-L-alanine amidase